MIATSVNLTTEEIKRTFDQYFEFRNQWVKENIDYRLMLETIENYKKDNQGCESFDDYVMEFGFIDGKSYPCFLEWNENRNKYEKEGR